MRDPAPVPGVLDAGYARARRRAPVLRYRYRSRALVAAGAARARLKARTYYRVLELGAADGLTLLCMRDLLGGSGAFHGVELSGALRAAAPALPPDTSLFAGDVTALPAHIAPDHYDLCAALAVLEHLPDPLACAREAFRVLRPGGVFVATCPAPGWDHIAGRLGLVRDDAHEQELGEQALVDLVRAAGFGDIEYRPFMWMPVGALPYLRVPVSPRLGLGIDRLVGRLVGRWPLARRGFVNQAIIATRPE